MHLVCHQKHIIDTKLLHEKNFIERLDSVKKLVNLWSSIGLTVYGKVTVIKSLITPKFAYICHFCLLQMK